VVGAGKGVAQKAGTATEAVVNLGKNVFTRDKGGKAKAEEDED